MARKKKGIFIDMYGVSELLQKIERAGGNVDQAVQKCVENSLEQVGLQMQLFMMSHRDTGKTYESYNMYPVVVKNGKVQGKVGYSVRKGGLPAIFLDLGTPWRKPHFFRYHAVEDSRFQIEQIQQETLNEIFKELM